jgi:hypothetical protein
LYQEIVAMRRWTVRTTLPIAWVFALMMMLGPAGTINGQDWQGDEADGLIEGADQPPGQEEAEAEEQADEPGDTEAKKGQRRRGRDDTKRLMKLHKEMLKEIELRDEQAGAINDLFEEHLKALRERAKEAGSEGEDDSDGRRELQEQYLEARRAQDRERMKELMAELRGLRGAAPGGSRIHTEFRKAVVAELDEEQAKQFNKLFRKIMMPGTQMREAMGELRVLQRAVHSLDLSEEQRQAVRRHLAGMGEALGLARAGDTDAAKRAITDIREAIIGELDEGQAGRLEEAEAEVREEMDRRRSERSFRGPGERSGRWRRPATSDEGTEAAGQAEADSEDASAHEESGDTESESDRLDETDG